MAKDAPKANAPAGPADGADAPKKKRRLKIIIVIVAALLILGAGAGGAYWWFFMRAQPSAPAGGGSAAPGAQGDGAGKRVEAPTSIPRSKVLPLPPFVVNLSDPVGKRVLKLGMEIEVNADVTSKDLQTNDAKIRDAVITLLAGKSFAEIQTPEGKVLLRNEVAARLNLILGGPKVVRVYFTEFVVD
ncbi:MAG: flagellar basal body-associated FliL family protein [Deltaproteobacteria bacterium]|jgi:flagellar FliL protein|nr:flagellar basal body-associated FliL family protein [Deltaproteobacteria bacterium]